MQNCLHFSRTSPVHCTHMTDEYLNFEVSKFDCQYDRVKGISISAADTKALSVLMMNSVMNIVKVLQPNTL